MSKQATTSKPDSAAQSAASVEIARRLLRAHGIIDEAFSEAAAATKRRQDALTAEDKQARDIPPDADPAEVWLLGSIPQMQRFWGGRCLTCQHWTANTRGNHGACDAIGAANTDKLVNVGRPDVVTEATFGCILWAEFPEDDATLRARAELAMALGLLPVMPDGKPVELHAGPDEGTIRRTLHADGEV